MRPLIPAGAAALLFAVVLPAALAAPRRAVAPPAPTYERDVLPLFRARCAGCHGTQPQAGLDVRTHGDLTQGGHSGAAIVPGSPQKSLLYQMLADGRMPKGAPKVPAAELKRVEQWILAGAPGSTGAGGHWAFRPPVRPSLPAVRAAARVRTPVDRFLLADLERRGLSYAPEADRRTLIRRVTFDLIGLPPTPAEMDEFLNDRRPDAYERVVDRLLADPRYGERWARHWLDTAGYADSEGVLQEDRVRPNAYHYRDYVIRSFNADKPYDQFVREQIAGDELVDYRKAERFTPELVETLAATGFLRTAVDGTRDDFNPHQYGEYQTRMLHDVQTIVATTVMGLTVQCARCHDHKYEPLSQKDYYRLQAFFTGAVRPRGAKIPSAARQIIAGSAAEQAQARETNARVDAALAELGRQEAALLRETRLKHLEAGLESVPEADRAALRTATLLEDGKRTPEQKMLVARHRKLAEATAEELAAAYPDFARRQSELRQAREAENRKRVTIPTIRAFYDQDANPPPTPILIRGDWLRPGETVEPGIPAVLTDARRPFTVPAPPPGAVTTGRRRALAEWLTRKDHPLTARVMVNRVWAHHFGVGLVPSVENFGRSGAPATNRALLDWLSVELAEGVTGARPWTLKPLHRLIVTSSAYRQGSAYRADGGKADPENRLLWRQRPRRLEAEAIRDATLAVAGTLDPTLYGEPVAIETRGTGEVAPVGEAQGGRRSIYLQVRRTMPVSVLNVFDAPVMETNCTRRSPSTTPSQALALMNGTFITSQAGHFARRVLRERPTAEGVAGTVDHAYRLALSRTPTPAERAATLDFLREQEARYRAGGKSGAAATEAAWADLCQALLSANEFVYLD